LDYYCVLGLDYLYRGVLLMSLDIQETPKTQCLGKLMRDEIWESGALFGRGGDNVFAILPLRVRQQ
jgi:hypothetical protein